MTDITTKERPSIGSLIRTALAELGDADPSGAVDIVVSRIDPFYYDQYLRDLIGSELNNIIGEQRRRNTPAIRKGVSTKQSLIRDEYWPRFLQQRIALPGGHKFLSEATAEDLRFLADVRRTQAIELSARADQFETLAGLMEKADVKHLEQLDPKAGTRVIAEAA